MTGSPRSQFPHGSRTVRTVAVCCFVLNGLGYCSDQLVERGFLFLPSYFLSCYHQTGDLFFDEHCQAGDGNAVRAGDGNAVRETAASGGPLLFFTGMHFIRSRILSA